jgi:hypothetical protein
LDKLVIHVLDALLEALSPKLDNLFVNLPGAFVEWYNGVNITTTAILGYNGESNTIALGARAWICFVTG